MLFNSYSFIFIFLPATIAGFFGVARFSKALAALWLTAASMFFYGWWDVRYVPLLLGSILLNYGIGYALSRIATEGNGRARRVLLTVGISGDLLLLGYFKYADFFLHSANALFGSRLALLGIVLPLGISFFTFTQIAFLVDAYFGKAREYRFVHYCLFVTYFPHLIAGPVLHHKEMMPQFEKSSTYRLQRINIAVGSTIFFLGLFKKAVLADGIAPYANAAFGAAGGGEHLQLFQAWGGALAYSLQLYFDFSGYSDMAIGLSRMFGINLPLNFNSPYKAANIIEFWRCWHMTLSRFLRDYLYIPLGGNRKGEIRRYVNLFATMLLGGLWHGAGWTFVFWGGLHGVYLATNHAWHALRKRLGHDLTLSTRIGRLVGWTVTFMAVVVGWVFFRANNIDTGWHILHGMAGGNGASLPAAMRGALGSMGGQLEHIGLEFTLGGGSQFLMTYLWVIGLLAVALFFPNTQQLMGRFEPALDYGVREAPGRSSDGTPWRWAPSVRWALTMGLVAATGILSLSHPSEFLYFQF